jgi:hypothetical protein
MEDINRGGLNIPRDITTQISRDQCACELEQISILIQQVTNHIHNIDTKLRQLEVLHQKVMGILKHEIDLTFKK